MLQWKMGKKKNCKQYVSKQKAPPNSWNIVFPVKMLLNRELFIKPFNPKGMANLTNFCLKTYSSHPPSDYCIIAAGRDNIWTRLLPDSIILSISEYTTGFQASSGV